MKNRLNCLFLVAALTIVAGASAAQDATPAITPATPATPPAATEPAAPVVTEPNAAQAAAPMQDTAVNTAYRADPEWMPKRDPQKGLLIVFRESRFVGGGVRMKLFSDGNALPPLKNGSFIYSYLEPGDHKIYSDKKKQRDARILDVEPGEVYFFEASIAMGMWKGSIDLLESSPEVAKQKMEKLKKPVPAKAK